MKAVFITTRTNDVDSVTGAWDYFNEPSGRVTFNHMKRVNDDRVLRETQALTPQIIFYIGSNNLEGSPSLGALKRLRSIAPSVNICFDGGDDGWHDILKDYARAGCFDLQVTIDGRKDAPVDWVMLAPVSPLLFDAPASRRDIRCGFSGNLGLTGPSHSVPVDPRGRILAPLVASGLVTLRERNVADGAVSYPEHVAFMRQCRIIINTSFTGSGVTHHLKQRVIESGFAGCALLESEGSPIADWFPEGSYFIYRDAAEAEHLIRTLSDEVIEQSAWMREAHTRQHYNPQKLFGDVVTRAMGGR